MINESHSTPTSTLPLNGVIINGSALTLTTNEDISNQSRMVAMIGIKLKVLKRSGTLHGFNGSHSPPTSSHMLFEKQNLFLFRSETTKHLVHNIIPYVNKEMIRMKDDMLTTIHPKTIKLLSQYEPQKYHMGPKI